MRVVRTAFACATAVIAGASVLAQAHWRGSGATEEFARRCGVLLAAERTGNDAYHDLWSHQPGSLARAIRGFERALLSDTASPSRWCDLGEAFVAAHLNERAEYCFARAAELGPFAPPILLRAANAYFELGDSGKALQHTSRVLAIVPDYDDLIFLTYGRMGIGSGEVLARGLPAGQPRAARAFLRHLLDRRALDEARAAWGWVCTHGLADDKIADDYASALLKANQPEAAVDAWAGYLGDRAGDYRRENYLFNGGFEHDPFGAALDWRIMLAPNVAVDRDSSVACSGKSSLRIRFDGTENVSYSNVHQIAFVKTPGTYIFEARVRAAGITTDQGIGFRIRDAEDNRRLDVYTSKLAGSTGWVPLRREIKVDPGTRLVDVAIIREPSTNFDSDIAGTAWIDDVRLAPAGGRRPPRPARLRARN